MSDRGFKDKAKAEGIIQKTIGMTKEVVSDVKDVAEEVVEKVKDKMQ